MTDTSPTALDSSRILIVDDQQTVRDVFGMILTHEFSDCVVDLACDGAQAVGMFLEGRHGLIIMDLRMPLMDGYTAYRHIKAHCTNNGWQPPAVIFCTSWDPPEGLENLVGDDSLYSILHKPIGAKALVDAVKAIKLS